MVEKHYFIIVRLFFNCTCANYAMYELFYHCIHCFNEHSSSVATSNLQRIDHLGTRFNQDKRFVLVLKCGFNLEFPAFDSHHHSMIIFSPSPSLGQKMKIKFWCIFTFFLKKRYIRVNFGRNTLIFRIRHQTMQR